MMTLAVIRNRRKRRIAEERMILAIDATLRNPASSIDTIKRQHDELIDNGIQIYDYDVNHWIFVGMEHNAYELLGYLLEIPMMGAGFSPETRFFEYLMLQKPQFIGRFLSYPYIQQEHWRDIFSVVKAYYHDAQNTYTIHGIVYKYQQELTMLFKQPNTLSLLESLGEYYPTKISKWRLINPDLKKKREMRLRLFRFWLLTVRRNLKLWIEHLYDPDGGPLVKKAARRFLTEVSLGSQQKIV